MAKSITTAASPRTSHALRHKTSQTLSLLPTSYKTTAQVQHLTQTRVPPAGKIGVWGKKIAEARRNCLAPMRQAAAKFFANLSAEKRGDLQNTSPHLLHRHTHTAVNIPFPVAPGAGAWGLRKPQKKAHGQSNKKSPRAK